MATITLTNGTLGQLTMRVPTERVDATVEALRMLNNRDVVVHEIVTVEVDVATRRPVGVHGTIVTTLVVERTDRTNVLVDAEQTAIHMAMCHPHVEMAVGARVIDWEE